MVRRHKTNKNWYLMNMILFIGFAFEFFVRGDQFFGAVLIFHGIINIVAYQNIPRKVANVTVILNLFNSLISLTVFYNYLQINFVMLSSIWFIILIAYVVSTIRQIVNLIRNIRFKRRIKKKND